MRIVANRWPVIKPSTRQVAHRFAGAQASEWGKVNWVGTLVGVLLHWLVTSGGPRHFYGPAFGDSRMVVIGWSRLRQWVAVRFVGHYSHPSRSTAQKREAKSPFAKNVQKGF